MTKNMIEPDLDFIREVMDLGGQGLKKCVQCSSCSVACTISPESSPYPRKEMIASSWGLKDRVISDHDIWLCHQCGDCSTLCPRGANPSDVLSAIRACAIHEYARPKSVGKWAHDPRKLPLLFLIPTALFLLVGLTTGLLDFTPGGTAVIHSHFFSHWLVELFFIPLMLWVIVIFTLGVKRFILDIHQHARDHNVTEKRTIHVRGFIRTLIRILPGILKHHTFSECNENRARSTSHMMVLISFTALALVAALFGTALHLLDIPGPYSQLNPVKWVANAAGVALVIGCGIMIRERREKRDQVSGYKDWHLLGLLTGLGITGLVVEMTRLADAAFLSYLLYFIHLILAFNLVLFLPFTKLAHLVYRTIALAYDAYIEREYKV